MTPEEQARDTGGTKVIPAAQSVDTAGRLTRVPNQPKTPVRGFRIPDDMYWTAKANAEERGEDLSSVVRALLDRYNKRCERERKRNA